MSKKIISFSLWGDIPMYNVGAIRNAELVSQMYPDGWIARFYIGSDVPQKTIDAIKELPATEIVDMSGTPNDWQGMFWRFYAINLEEDIDYVIFRDTDSRLSHREYMAVKEWISSGKTIHIMRDHPYHSEPIMGGMWGCKPKELIEVINKDIYKEHGIPEVDNIQEVIKNWMMVEWGRTERKEEKSLSVENYFTKGIDQRFLRAIIYVLLNKEAYIQDAFPMYNAWSGRFDWNRETVKEMNTGFPTKRGKDWNNFIGQVYNEHDEPEKMYADIIEERDKWIYEGNPANIAEEDLQ